VGQLTRAAPPTSIIPTAASTQCVPASSAFPAEPRKALGITTILKVSALNGSPPRGSRGACRKDGNAASPSRGKQRPRPNDNTPGHLRRSRMPCKMSADLPIVSDIGIRYRT
jgi:hypothetical protein